MFPDVRPPRARELRRPHGSLAGGPHAGLGPATDGVSASRAPDFLQQAGAMPAGPGFQRSPPTSSSPGPASAPDLQPPRGASARHPELSAPGRQRGSARTCPPGPGRGQLRPSRRASTDGPDPCVRSTRALAPSDRGSGRSSRQPLPLAPAAKPSRVAVVPALSFRSVAQRDLIKNCPQKPSASSREKTSPPTAGRISTTGRRPRGPPAGQPQARRPTDGALRNRGAPADHEALT